MRVGAARIVAGHGIGPGRAQSCPKPVHADRSPAAPVEPDRSRWPAAVVLAAALASAGPAAAAHRPPASPAAGRQGDLRPLGARPIERDPHPRALQSRPFRRVRARRPGDARRAVARAPARRPAKRIGSMFFNPGRPGEAGAQYLRDPDVVKLVGGRDRMRRQPGPEEPEGLGAGPRRGHPGQPPRRSGARVVAVGALLGVAGPRRRGLHGTLEPRHDDAGPRGRDEMGPQHRLRQRPSHRTTPRQRGPPDARRLRPHQLRGPEHVRGAGDRPVPDLA